MKKLLLTIICLVFCFYYVNSTCYESKDNYKADKKTCLDRKVNTTDENEYYAYEYYSFFDKNADTCCYVEASEYDISDQKEYKGQICLAFNKGKVEDDVKKFDDYLKVLEKELKEELGPLYDSKYLDYYKKPDINCFSSYLSYGFLALIVLIL